MLWLLLAFLTAFFSATEAAFLKRHFSGLRPMELGAVPLLYGLPYFLLALFFLPVPELKPGFWWTLLILYPFHAGGFLFLYWAISTAPLSLTMPYMATTPAFVLLSGYLILGEVPNILGGVGVVFIIIGGYVLNYDPKAKAGLLEPFRVIFHDAGALRALAAALLFSLAAVLGKKAVLQSSPLFFSFFFFVIFCSTTVALLFAFRLADRKTVTANHKTGFAVGAILFFHIICHNAAIALSKAAYMISIKRFSAVFGVIYGHFIFREANIKNRLAGATLMFIGVMLIALLGE
jgi:drug/metabolite transporter (DMT)-like permease